MANPHKHTIIIKSPKREVVEYIESAISNKRKRHEEIIKSIDPSIVENLRKMRKIEISRP